MLYEATPDNLRLVVRTAGALAREQLLRFFSDTDDTLNVEYYIKELVAQRIFDYDQGKDIVSWHTAPQAAPSLVSSRIQAFWIIVSFRSKYIKEIVLLPYPSQFLFITHGNDVYDISFCSGTTDAMLVKRAREATLCEGLPDEVNHIALVSSEKVGQQLGAYGFDSFCVLDQDHKPQYRTWG